MALSSVLQKYSFLSLACFLSILGCTETPSESILRFGVSTVPNNFDPRFATDAISARLNRLLYSRLVDFGAQSLPSPSLTTWEKISPTHYQFTLLQSPPTFHNGQQLTAKDIKATYDTILDPHTASPHRSSLRIISEIKISGDSTIDFFLQHADALFPGYLVIGILPANLIAQNHPFREHPIGSGPFEFLGKPDETRVRIKRRSDEQLLEFIRVPDPTVRTLKLLAGEIHLLQNDLPPELVTYLSSHKDVTVRHYQGSKFAYLGFNQLDPIVGQLSVRKAIAHAINREDIIQFVFGGRARPAQGVFPPNHWAGLSNTSGYDYDPELAKHLLKKAGFSASHPPKITYKTSTDPFRLRLATIIQAQLQQVGIDVSIHSHDWGTFYGDIKAGRFQMYSLAWVGLNTPDFFRYAFHSSSLPPHGANRGHFSSVKADDLIHQGERASEVSIQQRVYHSLQEHLLATLPYVPLWYEDHLVASSQKIIGYQPGSDGNYDGLLHVNWRSTEPSFISQVRQHVH